MMIKFKARQHKVSHIALALCVLVSAGQLSASSMQHHAQSVSQQDIIIAELDCATNTQQVSDELSWSAWITGKTRSYRFHFLDLLELLSRNNQDVGDNS